jgi:hypothetical protein
MTDTWTTPADTRPARELDPAMASAVADVLETVVAWSDGEITTPQALTIALHVPRAIGEAFRSMTTDDPRWTPLERLHAIEYAQREDEWGQRKVYTTFGWVSRPTLEQVERHMTSPDFDTLRYHRKAA